MIAGMIPWGCLLNGHALQLEPLPESSGFQVRRKAGGKLIGQVHITDPQRPTFLTTSAVQPYEGAEVLRILRPWLGGRAKLTTLVRRSVTWAPVGWRHYQHRRQGLGPAHDDPPGTWLARFGIDPDYSVLIGSEPIAEPSLLHPAGQDRHGRMHWLLPAAIRPWQMMRAAANADGVTLEIVSGFRSAAHQANIFRRKLARGLSLRQILEMNAAPGFSEHHSGRALDLTTPHHPPAEASFESTTAFAWLNQHAGHFGFVLSYPRDNPQGFVYEPWHWCWHAP